MSEQIQRKRARNNKYKERRRREQEMIRQHCKPIVTENTHFTVKNAFLNQKIR